MNAYPFTGADGIVVHIGSIGTALVHDVVVGPLLLDEGMLTGYERIITNRDIVSLVPSVTEMIAAIEAALAEKPEKP